MGYQSLNLIQRANLSRYTLNDQGWIARSRELIRLLDEPGLPSRSPTQETSLRSLADADGRAAHMG